MKKSSKVKNGQPFKLEGITINKDLMEKFLSKEKTKKINDIDDLSELNTKSQSELFDIISQMMINKTFFKYCYSLLININPGPEHVYDYLNLKEWLNEQNHIPTEKSEKDPKNKKDEKKPHLYSFMKYVYDTMLIENKNQVVSILGPLGSGKTFNLIHIMEYFTTLYSPEVYALDNFDLVHKSIQFIHILSSTFREYNLESSSCGLLLSLGFNEKNMICNFNIDAQILDFTLPFNENGRTFSILYALIRGANDNLKRKCKIPVNIDNLFNLQTRKKNYFVSDKKKEKLELNDLEIFNRFYSLLKYFKFTQGEIIDIINCLALMLNLNELMAVHKNGEKRGQMKKVKYYEIQIGVTTKKIAKNFGIFDPKNIEIFEKKLHEIKFKSMQEMDIFIQSLIKQTYYIVFQYVLEKIQLFISDYFNNLNNIIINKSNSKRKQKEPKYIYFIDFPGEVEEKTLGGFTINIANECLNIYSASGYNEIVEKILLENILLNRFKPLKSYTLLSNCFNKGGILENFSNKLNLKNFEQMKQNISANQNMNKCFTFPEIKKSDETDYTYYCSFSNKNVKYNFDFLYNETKSLLFNPKIYELYSFASNIIIKQMYKKSQLELQEIKTFYNYYSKCLQKFFTPIKDYKPFVVYCLHSNDSHKYFFCTEDEKCKLSNIKDNNSDMYINIVKHSMIPVILNWNWYGFKEWIKLDDFIKEYAKDFEAVKNRIIYINKIQKTSKGKREANIDFKKLEKKDKAKCILEVLSKPNDFVIGDEYIIMKLGTLKKITKFLNSMIDTAEELAKNLSSKITSNSNSINNSRYLNSKKNTPSEQSEKRRSKVKENNIFTNHSNKSKRKLINIEKYPLPKKKDINKLENNLYKEKPEKRRNLLKEQCELNVIYLEKAGLNLLSQEEKNKMFESKYLNIVHILNKNNEEKVKTEDAKINELINYQDEKSKNNIPTKNNTIISDPIFFDKIRTLFDNSKPKNVKIFDYSDNIDLIIRIQTFYRNLLAQKRFKILKYVTHKIIEIQKVVRGMLVRKKYSFFIKCSKSVLLLQKAYRNRYKQMNKKAKKIQKYYRKKIKDRNERYKIVLRKKLEVEKEKHGYLNVDQIYKRVMNMKKDNNVHNLIANFGEGMTKLNEKVIQKNNKVDVTNDLIKEKNNKNIIKILLYSHLPEDNIAIRKKLKRSKSDIFKVEDKLIYEGRLQKEKREKLERKQEMENSKIPEYSHKLSKRNEMIMKKYPDNFLKRVEYFQLFKKRNLENLRNKNYKHIRNELKFEPKIYNNELYDNIQSRLLNQNENRSKLKDDNPQIDEIFNEETWKNNLRSGDLSTSYDNNMLQRLKSANKFIINNFALKDFINNERGIWPKDLNYSYLNDESKVYNKNNDV